MIHSIKSLLLADDDIDDCLFFKEALDELQLTVKLITTNDGEALMNLLNELSFNLPDVLFLDLNMPRKNGFDCLTEIRKNEKFEVLPVVIFSTSYDNEVVNKLYGAGAHYYIRKPGEFSNIKRFIHKVLELLSTNKKRPSFSKFVINR
jgi:CheY-like chemotaxis protein